MAPTPIWCFNSIARTKPRRPPLRRPQEPEADDWSDLLILSAHTPDALDAVAKAHVGFLRQAPASDWTAIRATAARSRARHAHRLIVSAATTTDAADRLDSALAGEKPTRLARGRSGAGPVRTAFVYSGNGPQWWGMGRELLAQSQVFRDDLAATDAIFKPLAGWSILDKMAEPEDQVRIELTEFAQPLLFAQQLALTAVLRAAGVRPDAVFGHSVGEAAAAYASGALTREQAVEVIVHRSQMQALTAGRGRMAALGVGVAEAREAIAAVSGWLEIAAINSPRAVTVAGELSALEVLRDRLTDEGKFVRILPLNYPFHTAAMDAIQGPLSLRLRDLKPGASAIPFISTVEGVAVEGASLDADYWWRNIRAPVQFDAAATHALSEQKIDVFLEVGPHPVLKDYLQQVIKASEGSSAQALSTLRRPSASKPAPELETLKTAVCAVYAAGAGDPKAIFERPATPAKLPSYPWSRTRFWRGACELPDAVIPVEKEHPLLGHRLAAGDGVWTNTIQTTLLPYLNDHVVQGAPLFPAAGYVELAFAAAGTRFGDGAVDVETLEIQRPLVLPQNAEPLVQVTVDAADGTLTIRSRPDLDTADWTDHVKGRISRVDGDAVPATVDLASLRAVMPVTVDGSDHYRDCDRRGLTYGTFFQGVATVSLTAPDAVQRSALGEIGLPVLEGALDGYRCHPGVLDSCLQVLITLIGQNTPIPTDRTLRDDPGSVGSHPQFRTPAQPCVLPCDPSQRERPLRRRRHCGDR